ncbi:MAG: hypothetical protein HXX17_03350 [Geobacteraceae bacterium]|nr:hypothetical protein [Geobacteraceae bacterium]
MRLSVRIVKALLLFVTLLLSAGCGPTIFDAKRAINEAMQYQEDVSRTGITENATPDVPLIKSKISEAEKSMKFLLFPRAVESARDSIDASKRVLLYLDAKRLIDEAREYQDTVKRSASSGSSSPDIASSVQKFDEAEKQLAEQQYQRAISAAKDSITSSKRVILQGITSSVKVMKEEIVRKQEENPATPLKKILPRLDEILQFANDVQNDEKGLEQMSLVKAASITSDLKVYEEDIKSSQQEKLQSDISFAMGKYDLAQDGKAALEKFAEKIVANIDSSLILFPDKPLILQVDVYGYTDSSGFLSDGGNLKKRALLNQRLSELRAKSVSDCLNRALTQKLASYGSKVVIHAGKVVGKGEEPPPGVQMTAQATNPQRRICQIFSTTVHDVVK